jgi:hypothetical protein
LFSGRFLPHRFVGCLAADAVIGRAAGLARARINPDAVRIALLRCHVHIVTKTLEFGNRIVMVEKLSSLTSGSGTVFPWSA